MKRYYLSKISVVEEEPGMTVISHRLQNSHHNVDKVFTAHIATGPDGLPTSKAVLCIVGAIDHRPLDADGDLVALPDMKPHLKVSATHTPTKNIFKEKCKALGFAAQEIDDVVANSDGWADVIDHFGKKNNPAFDYRNFDIDES